MTNLSSKSIVTLATIFALSFIGVLLFFRFHKSIEPISCTLEAKICPDGSAVGRTGPKCKFSPCPEVSPTPPISGWKTYVFDNYPLSLRYPSDWSQYKWEFSSDNSIINLVVYGSDVPTISDFLAKQDEISAKGWEGSYSIKVNSTKKTVIAGLNCIQRQETVLAGDFETYSTYFRFGNNFYQLSIRPKNSSDLNLNDVSIYQQILSTIKFLN